MPGGTGSAARIVAEGLVGAVFAVIHARLLCASRRLRVLSNPLMAMLALPYLGARRLRAAAATPRAAAHAAPTPGSIRCREIDMRLTYRTVRVLPAIDELGERGRIRAAARSPTAAGISDQGQMSKLLARLRRSAWSITAPAGAAKANLTRGASPRWGAT